MYLKEIDLINRHPSFFQNEYPQQVSLSYLSCAKSTDSVPAPIIHTFKHPDKSNICSKKNLNKRHTSGWIK
jgi:hypothetical protein